MFMRQPRDRAKRVNAEIETACSWMFMERLEAILVFCCKVLELIRVRLLLVWSAIPIPPSPFPYAEVYIRGGGGAGQTITQFYNIIYTTSQIYIEPILTQSANGTCSL